MENKKIRLSNKEKLDLMLDYINATGKKITANTKYKGYNIGYLKNNLRQMYYNGTLNIEEDLLEEFIKVGIIANEKEKNRTSQQEKYEFLMSLVDKSEEEKKQAKMKNGLTYNEVKYQLQIEYNRNNIKLTDIQIQNLRKGNMLSYSKQEMQEIAKSYKMPSKYAIEIMKRYRNKENFTMLYKKGECEYNFENVCFCGFRGIAISQNNITVLQKLQYAILLKHILHMDIKEFEYDKGKYLDIDKIDNLLKKLPNIKLNVFRCYYALDGKKYMNKEIESKFGLARGRCGQIISKSIIQLRKDFIDNKNLIIRDYKEDCNKLIEYNSKINQLNEDLENINIINKCFLSMSEKFENAVKNISLEELGLSVRTYNCLLKANIKNLYDLIQLTKYELMEIRNLGWKSFDEVMNLLKDWNLTLRREYQTKYELEPISILRLPPRIYNCLKFENIELSKMRMTEEHKNKLIKKKIFTLKDLINQYDLYSQYNLSTDYLEDIDMKNISLEELGFSVRTYNCLSKANIKNLYDLMQLREYELIKIRNLGKKSFDEVINLVEDWNLIHNCLIRANVKILYDFFINITNYEVRNLLKEGYFTLSKEDNKIKYILEPISILGLPPRVYNCLIRANIKTLYDFFVNITKDDLKNIRNLGYKKPIEIINTLISRALKIKYKKELEDELENNCINQHLDIINIEYLIKQAEFKQSEFLQLKQNILEEQTKLQEKIDEYNKVAKIYINDEDIFNKDFIVLGVLKRGY